MIALPGRGDGTYWSVIERWAKDYGSDGCTKSPDLRWCIHGCWEHDFHHRYGVTLYGERISFEETNVRFRQVIQMWAPLHWFSPTSWSYWWAVSSPMGRKLWDNHRREGLASPVVLTRPTTTG